MPSITVRNIPDEVHRRLRIRAAKSGRSMEEELRVILAIVTGVGRPRIRPAAQEIKEEAPDLAIEALTEAAPITLDKTHETRPDTALSKVREFLKTQIATDVA